MKFASIVLASSLVLAAACGDDDDPATTDAASADASGAVVDADPNAPDAEPIVYDADPAAPDAEPDDFDANPGVVDQVVCGESTCDAPQVCCVTYQSGVSYACTGAEECTQGASIACDGPEDCTTMGEVCCAGSGMSPDTSCVEETGCERVLCREEDDCAVGDQSCCPLLDLGISICGNFC